MTDSGTTAKDRVRAQYASVGDAYVKSTGHATGKDLQRMVEVALPQPNERMLDLATGGGHVPRVFAPHVAEVVASDLTPEILTHAAASFAEQGLANVTTALVDAEEIPYPHASFDLVTCRIAPHHFPHPGRFVQEAARVLTSGGRFVLIDSTVPEGEPGDFFNRFEMLRDPSHVRSLTIADWQALIEQAGLVLDLTETFHKRHDFADWTSRSRMTDEDRNTLERMMLDADPAIREEHHAEIVDGRLIAFQDTKTLFLARKP
jgi:ubiquinone/menaquinone biosynthesis C-methylase UbiE